LFAGGVLRIQQGFKEKFEGEGLFMTSIMDDNMISLKPHHRLNHPVNGAAITYLYESYREVGIRFKTSKTKLLLGQGMVSRTDEEEVAAWKAKLAWEKRLYGEATESEEAHQDIEHKAEEDLKRDYIVFCGAPLGNLELSRAYVEARLCGPAVRNICQQVAELPDSQGILYYVTKSLIPKATFLARTTPPVVYKDAAVLFDSMVMFAAMRHLATPGPKGPPSLMTSWLLMVMLLKSGASYPSCMNGSKPFRRDSKLSMAD
jgi:hypothetical protein